MMRRMLTAMAVAGVVVLGSGGLAGAAVRAAVSPWAEQAVPLPPTYTYGKLGAVSCVSAARCMGIGLGTEIAERWNGTKWVVSTISAPGLGPPYLIAVSCPAADSCVAVGLGGSGGSDATLAMSWNGATWAVMPGPEPEESPLYSVSCVSPSDCLAVGWNDNPGIPALAMSWNGTTWAAVATPAQFAGDDLYSVSCATATSCLVLGQQDPYADGPRFALSWNGATWTTLPTPPVPAGASSGGVDAVSCPSAGECMAVGSYINAASTAEPMADLWNGSGWTLQTVPAESIGGGLGSVSCPSVTYCAAVGGPRGLAASWNGTRWTRQNVPRPASAKFGYYLSGVSCGAVRTCETVGYYSLKWDSYYDAAPLAARR
jgi:hypothetical protein